MVPLRERGEVVTSMLAISAWLPRPTLANVSAERVETMSSCGGSGRQARASSRRHAGLDEGCLAAGIPTGAARRSICTNA